MTDLEDRVSAAFGNPGVFTGGTVPLRTRQARFALRLVAQDRTFVARAALDVLENAGVDTSLHNPVVAYLTALAGEGTQP